MWIDSSVDLQDLRARDEHDDERVDRWTSEDLREKALKDLQQSDVLMLDGHFDYGNGYHGRVYLNPHQLFRHPSTIWRFAQDLIDLMPADLLQRTEVVAGPGHRRRAARAHDRRPARQPPQPDASALHLRAVQLRSGRRLHAARRSTARELDGKRVLLADDVRNTGQTFARCAALVKRGGRTVVATVEIYDRMEVGRRSRRAEHRAGRIQGAGQLQRGDCPLCRAGIPITRF